VLRGRGGGRGFEIGIGGDEVSFIFGFGWNEMKR
jgi:hypothetical protein